MRGFYSFYFYYKTIQAQAWERKLEEPELTNWVELGITPLLQKLVVMQFYTMKSNLELRYARSVDIFENKFTR